MSPSLQYGNRLLNDVVAHFAKHEPEKTWISVPRHSSDASKGWEDISFARYHAAIDYMAWELEKGIGRGAGSTTIAFVGANDSRYPIFHLAALKAGYVALFISPRNPIEGQQSLFKDTDCQQLCHTREFEQAAVKWTTGTKVKTFGMSDEHQYLNAKNVPPHPFKSKPASESAMDVSLILHTSGSTSLPKPIVWRHGALMATDSFNAMPPTQGRESAAKRMMSVKRMFSTMPLFHAGGMLSCGVNPIYGDVVNCLPPPSKPVNVDLIIEGLRYSGATGLSTAPSMYEELANDPEALRLMRPLEMVLTGGGGIASRPATLLREANIKMFNIIGATETIPLANLMTTPEEFPWFAFDDETAGIEWRNANIPGREVYEMVIVRKKDWSKQGAFYAFPEKNEFSTNDLFERHPTKPDLWRTIGRADNIIVFSNGEKLSPNEFEDKVTGHPKVKGALVVGSGKFQPAMFIEPREDPPSSEQGEQFIDEVWPLIAAVNETAPTHGRIGRQFIRLTTPGKPFPRAGKGTIQRGAAVIQYRDEIERFFETLESSMPQMESLETGSLESFTASVVKAFNKALADDGSATLEADSVFFEVGMDSLQILTLSRTLKAAVAKSDIEVDEAGMAPRALYTHHSPRALCSAIYSPSGAQVKHVSAEEEMKAMVEKYTTGLQSLDAGPKTNGASKRSTENLTIAITGTTGALGSYLLHFLIQDPNIKHIFALNRTEDAPTRQKERNSSQGLSTDFSKVTFIKADLSQPHLGLEEPLYTTLQNSTDRIIHNAWPVNFNLTLPSFEPYIRGVRHLIDLSGSFPKRPNIIFISSIGTVGNWDPTSGPVPETPLQDLSFATPGYGQSKLISSLILDTAREIARVPSTIVRVGQIAGPTTTKGVWNRHEWLPTIVKSSLYLGVLPTGIGAFTDAIDWCAIDPLAKFVLELGESQGYYHAVCPRSTTWWNLLPALRGFYGGRIKKEVPFKEWIELLKKSAVDADTANVVENPGIKLLDTFEGFAKGEGRKPVRYATEKSCEVSPTLRELKAVTPELMRLWAEQWAF